VPAITRKTSKGLPRYVDESDSDVFILCGAEDLVPLLVETDGSWGARQLDADDRDHPYEISAYRPQFGVADAVRCDR
jgi:Salmonella virulence plasmid 65kDa B protein